MWKSKYSVLIGDYLLSRGLEISVQNNDFKFLGILSNAVKQMSEGEITQLKKSKSLDIDEDTYFKIIKEKTLKFIFILLYDGCYFIKSL